MIETEIKKWKFWLKFSAYFLSIIPIILTTFYFSLPIDRTFISNSIFYLPLIILPILYARKLLKASNTIENEVKSKTESEVEEIFYNVRSFVNSVILYTIGGIVILGFLIAFMLMLSKI